MNTQNVVSSIEELSASIQGVANNSGKLMEIGTATSEQAGGCGAILNEVDGLNAITKEIGSDSVDGANTRSILKLREIIQGNSISSAQLAFSSEQLST